MPLTIFEPIVAPAPKMADAPVSYVHMLNNRMERPTGIAHLLAELLPVFFKLARYPVILL
jgi:hypothetical protein